MVRRGLNGTAVPTELPPKAGEGARFIIYSYGNDKGHLAVPLILWAW
jgi:hypothetical protein